MHLHGGHGYLPLDIIHPTAVKDILDDIGEDLDDDTEMQCPSRSSCLMTKIGIEKFIMMF